MLEDSAKPSVASVLTRINEYSKRSKDDFDKYKAISLVESLEYTAKSTAHEKASYYQVVLLSLKEKLSTPVDKFRSYFLSLLGDRDYEKVLTTMAKVDKALGSSHRGPPQRGAAHTPGVW